MTNEKIQEAIDIYRKEFIKRGIGKIDYPHDEILLYPKDGLEHCHGMLDKMEEFIKEGRKDKVYRWLGFIQGVLWSQHIYKLEDLMSHNHKDV